MSADAFLRPNCGGLLDTAAWSAMVGASEGLVIAASVL